MALPGQSQDVNETEIVPSSSDANHISTFSENSGQVALRQWHTFEQPLPVGPVGPVGPQFQTSFSQTHFPNVSVHNYFIIPPDYAVNGSSSLSSFHTASSSVMSSGHNHGYQLMRPMHPTPSLTHYSGSTPYIPSISRSAGYIASLADYNNSTHAPAISELSTSDIVETNSYYNNNNAVVAHQSIHSQNRSLMMNRNSSINQRPVETLSRGDTIPRNSSSNEEIMQDPFTDSVDLSGLDDFLADNDWKSGASSRILQGLLHAGFTDTRAERGPSQDAAPPSTPPVTESLDLIAPTTRAQLSLVDSLEKSTSQDLSSSNAAIVQTPVRSQQPLSVTPLSANANRSTIARDVLRALRPPSTKRKRVESESHPSLISSPLKKTKTDDTSDSVPHGPISPGVIPPGFSIPPTSVTMKNLISAQSSENGATFPTSPLSVARSNDRTADLSKDMESRPKEPNHMDNFGNPLLTLNSITEDHLGNKSSSIVDRGMPLSLNPLHALSDGMEIRLEESDDIDNFTNPLLVLNSIAQDHVGNKPSVIVDREMVLSPANPVPIFSDTLSSQPEGLQASTESPLSPSLDNIAKSRIPLFLPSEPSSPASENSFPREHSPSTSSLATKPLPISSVKSKRLVPSNRRPYVQVPTVRNLKINYGRSSQLEGKEKRTVEPDYVEVEQSRDRLTERRCLWRGCSAILDSAEKLIKHTKIVHGNTSNEDFYICQWNGCTRLRTSLSSEDLTAHLKDHVNITCPYRGCAYKTKQGKQLVNHVTASHNTQRDDLRPSALPDRLVLQPAVQVLENCPAYFSVPIPVTAKPITKERHQGLQSTIRARIVEKLKPRKITGDTVLLTDYEFRNEVTANKPFCSLMPMSPTIKKIDVLEGSLLDSVVIMEMGHDHDGNLAASDLTANIEVDANSQLENVEIDEGFGTNLGPNLLQAPRDEHDFLEVEALL